MRESESTLVSSSGAGLPARILRRLRRGLAGRAESMRLAAAPKHRLLVEQLPLVTYVEAVTPAGASFWPSPQVEEMLGYPVRDWLSDPGFFAKILHPDDREIVLTLAEDCIRTGKAFAREYRLVARDGRVVWVQDERGPFDGGGGTPLFTEGYLLDITARKESEQRLSAEHGVAHVLGKAKTLDEAAPEILRVVCEAFSWEAGGLWLLDRSADALRRASTHGTPTAGDDGLADEGWARRDFA